MANTRYKLGWEKFLKGQIDVTSNTIKVALVKTAYSPNFTTHEFVSDLGANILARSSGLSSKSASLGTFDAADVTFSAVAGGDQGTYLVLYKDSGSDATSPLIGAIDTGSGLPITTNGGDITVQWSNGSDKIFTLLEELDPKVVENIATGRRISEMIAGWFDWAGLPAPVGAAG